MHAQQPVTPVRGARGGRGRWWRVLCAAAVITVVLVGALADAPPQARPTPGPAGGGPGAAGQQQHAVQPAPPLRGGLGPAPTGAPDDPPGELEPGDPARPPATGTIAAGATVQISGGGGWAGAFDRADTEYGPLEMLRVFHSGLPPAWPGSAADTAGRTVNVSFKAHPRDVLAGAHDRALTDWFAGMPSDRDIYWTYYHEPEDNIEAGEFSAADYREAWRRVAGLASEVANPRRYATLVLMGWTLEPGSGRDWRDYYPGGDVIAVLGWDIYNLDYAAGEYSAPEVLFDRAIEASRAEGKPWGIAEYGGRRVPGDGSGQRRAGWIRATTGYLADHEYPPLWVAWYDALIGDGEDYRLADDPSRTAWQEFVRSQQ